MVLPRTAQPPAQLCLDTHCVYMHVVGVKEGGGEKWQSANTSPAKHLCLCGERTGQASFCMNTQQQEESVIRNIALLFGCFPSRRGA